MLQAGVATATIDPTNGGNLKSLALGSREILVEDRGDSRVPVPRYGSVVLAPWVGELHSGVVEFHGQSIRLRPNVGRHAVHGLVQSGRWKATSIAPDRASLVRAIGKEWIPRGIVQHDIALDSNGITLAVTVRADRAAMPCSIGWHPWFRCETPERSRLLVDAANMLELDDELIPTGRVMPVAPEVDLRDAPVLLDRRLDVVYLDVAPPVVYTQPDLQLKVHWDPGISVVVVYLTDGAVCIEPWSAWPDAWRMSQLGFASGVRVLEPGQHLEHETRWSWAPGESG